MFTNRVRRGVGSFQKDLIFSVWFYFGRAEVLKFVGNINKGFSILRLSYIIVKNLETL